MSCAIELCLECGCDSVGSVSSECDSTGNCTCNDGFDGVKCDNCAEAYYSPEFGKCEGKAFRD